MINDTGTQESWLETRKSEISKPDKKSQMFSDENKTSLFNSHSIPTSPNNHKSGEIEYTPVPDIETRVSTGKKGSLIRPSFGNANTSSADNYENFINLNKTRLSSGFKMVSSTERS
jgi:hypothetical protein